MPKDNYAKSYSEPSLWKKLGSYAAIAGKEVVEKVLTLFEALKDRDTPGWARGVIIAAIGYFISPFDAIPDVIPGAGYADDLGAVAAALATVAAHIKKEHVLAAKERLEKWFGRGARGRAG
jgi:uncharacterized membrane protein YkvA (DUF1232 family)